VLFLRPYFPWAGPPKPVLKKGNNEQYKKYTDTSFNEFILFHGFPPGMLKM